jgi:hypothetical protein
MLDLVRRGRDSWSWLLVSRRLQLAVKGAVAAVLAWVAAEAVTHALPGEGLENYLYYAPLGAVVATDATVVSSVRIARQTALALVLGALLGLGGTYLIEPGLLSLALVVVLGVLLGSLPGLGEMRSWIPVVALFVLVIGGVHAESYAMAYVGLTALGAACGVLVNLLFPALPFRQEQQALAWLRHQVAAQLEDIADGLRTDPPPDSEGWRARNRDTGTVLEQARFAVRELVEAQQGNLVEGGRHRGWVDQQAGIAAALDRVALLVEDLLVVLTETHREDLPTTPLDAELAETVACALGELAALVRVYDESLTAEDERVTRVEGCMERLTEEFSQRRDLDARDLAVLGTVVANLKRSTAAVRPPAPAGR